MSVAVLSAKRGLLSIVLAKALSSMSVLATPSVPAPPSTTAEAPLIVPPVPPPINDSKPPPNKTPSVKLMSEPNPISAAFAANASALPSRNSPADSANASLATVAAEVVPRPVSPRLTTSSKPPKPAKLPAPALANKYGAFSSV